MEKMFSIPISRRDFMKMTGLAAAGVLAVNTVGMPETVLAASEGGAHGTIKYAGKEIPVLYSVDVCVAGGGPSGTAAAIMAAWAVWPYWDACIPLWIPMRRTAILPM